MQKNCSDLYPSCIECNSLRCTRCDWKVYVNGSCSSSCSDPNCLDCTNGTCIWCPPGYTLNMTTWACLMNTSPIPFCQVNNSAGVCTRCILGYYLNNGLCFPCGSGCDVCSSSTECLHCNDSFVLSDGICGNTCPFIGINATLSLRQNISNFPYYYPGYTLTFASYLTIGYYCSQCPYENALDTVYC